jgi:hypothetical protein
MAVHGRRQGGASLSVGMWTPLESKTLLERQFKVVGPGQCRIHPEEWRIASSGTQIRVICRRMCVAIGVLPGPIWTRFNLARWMSALRCLRKPRIPRKLIGKALPTYRD